MEDIINKLLDQLKKLKSIVNNIKKLFIKGITWTVFKFNNKINKIDNNISRSIKNIKNKLNSKNSIGLWILIILSKIIKILRKISNKNKIILEEIILDIDESDNYLYSRTNNKNEDDNVYYTNWKNINFESEEENVKAGECAYSFMNIGEDEFTINMYFDNNNEPISNVENNINNRKKGKYLFCKDAIEKIYNKISDKNIEFDSCIEQREDIQLGCEIYKVKFYYGANGYVLAVLYELKHHDEWIYTCAYKIEEAHNILNLHKFNILHNKDSYFNILNEDEIKNIIDKIRLYRIKNNSIDLGEIINEMIKDITVLVATTGIIFVTIKEVVNQLNQL